MFLICSTRRPLQCCRRRPRVLMMLPCVCWWVGHIGSRGTPGIKGGRRGSQTVDASHAGRRYRWCRPDIAILTGRRGCSIVHVVLLKYNSGSTTLKVRVSGLFCSITVNGLGLIWSGWICDCLLLLVRLRGSGCCRGGARLG